MHILNIIKPTALIAGLSFTSCQNTADLTNEFDPFFIEVGEEIATTHCAACHSVGLSGSSPRADTPPLRSVLTTYSPDTLADDFREHIHVGRPDMPDFEFTVKETEGLLAYLSSIQETSK